jgi:glutaredoxin
MAALSHSSRWIVGAALLATCACAYAQTAPVYRYTDPDGRVIYTDRPPPADAKNLQTKRVGGNFIEASEPSYQAQLAAERFPVTLFTFDCGDVCRNAEGLLNKRGVPFTTVNVQEPQGANKLQAVTGDLQAPVLAVGDKLIGKGYNESRWQALLDEAGYPKTPPPRNTATSRVRSETAAAPPPPPVAGTQSVAPPARGGDYPK